MATVITGSGITTPQVDSTVINENGLSIATEQYVDGKMVLGTAVNSTSGTSIDFTGIPNWVKRLTIMFDAVSLSGTSTIEVRIGSGTFATSGYTAGTSAVNMAAPNSTGGITSSSGFIIDSRNASAMFTGKLEIYRETGNVYISTHTGALFSANYAIYGGGRISLAGIMDRVRLTTTNGTDTFDNGSINIMYEG